MKFHFLTGDVDWQTYGGKWISGKLNNGEFDYWLVRELIPGDECDIPQKYLVTLSVVAPEQYEDKESALAYCGIEEDWNCLTDRDKVEVIHSYSGGTQIWSGQGNNYQKLFAECLREAELQGETLFGFAMDRRVNALGDSGWDRLKGVSVLDKKQG